LHLTALYTENFYTVTGYVEQKWSLNHDFQFELTKNIQVSNLSTASTSSLQPCPITDTPVRGPA
jgi:hypothetical protein